MSIVPTKREWKSFWKDYKKEILVGAALGFGYSIYVLYTNGALIPTNTMSVFDYVVSTTDSIKGYASQIKTITTYTLGGAVIGALGAIIANWFKRRK